VKSSTISAVKHVTTKVTNQHTKQACPEPLGEALVAQKACNGFGPGRGRGWNVTKPTQGRADRFGGSARKGTE
jgi:hypothetical protein